MGIKQNQNWNKLILRRHVLKECNVNDINKAEIGVNPVYTDCTNLFLLQLL